jgi:hypothetical protein
MNSTLYGLEIGFKSDAFNCTNWIKYISNKNAPLALFDYGFQITPKGLLIIAGGLTNSQRFTRRSMNFNSHREVWLLNLAFRDGRFTQISSLGNIYGFTKIISLGGELVSIVNRNIGILLLNLEEMQTYPLEPVTSFTRTSFAIVPLNETSFLVIGGYDVHGNRVAELGKDKILVRITFSNISSSSNLIRIIISVISILTVMVITVVIYLRYRYGVVQPENNRDIEIKVEEVDCNDKFNSTVPSTFFDSKTYSATRNTNLSIPGYRKYECGVDFLIDRQLDQGGFGMIYVGYLVNDELVAERNLGENICVIKTYLNENINRFHQELSIHEVFADNKHFARLLCYSENPYAIVLKYYKHGSLNKFLSTAQFPKEYNLATALTLGIQIVHSIMLMHSKGFIHNDIKVENILVESDFVEKHFFAVICDFGCVEVMNSVRVIPGFQIMDTNSGTIQYCAPEVLIGFKNKIRISSKKTDVYSIGLVLFHLFTKKQPWTHFQIDFVIGGGLPDF